MADAGEKLVTMARIGAPHGVRGAVRLTVFAEDPLALRRYNPFTDDAGRTLKLKAVRAAGKSHVAEIEGVASREEADRLRGAMLRVPRRRLPRPDDEEYYHVDLIGLEAQLEDGTVLGRVAAVNDFGAGDVLEIGGTRSVLVPFTREVVPHVDLAAGRLVVAPLEGLLEDADESARNAESAQSADDDVEGSGG